MQDKRKNQTIKAFIVHNSYVKGRDLEDHAADVHLHVDGIDNAKAAQQGLRDKEGR